MRFAKPTSLRGIVGFLLHQEHNRLLRAGGGGEAPPPEPPAPEPLVFDTTNNPLAVFQYSDLDQRVRRDKTGSNQYFAYATSILTQKSYFEVKVGVMAVEVGAGVGLISNKDKSFGGSDAPGSSLRDRGVAWTSNGSFYKMGAVSTAVLPTYDDNDVLMIAFDPDPFFGYVWFGKNGVWTNDPSVASPHSVGTDPTDQVVSIQLDNFNRNMMLRSGADLLYTPPAGFTAL